MLTIEVKKIINVMKLVRRVSFTVSVFAVSVFIYMANKGIEYELSGIGMAVIVCVPLLMLVTSGRWWEGLAGKEYIGFSIKREIRQEEVEMSDHFVLEHEVYHSESI